MRLCENEAKIFSYSLTVARTSNRLSGMKEGSGYEQKGVYLPKGLKIPQDGRHERKAIAMTIREIRNELEKIYKERKSWDGAKEPFTEPAIRQRELILIKQQILYRIEDAKLLKDEDEDEESFNLTLYKIINNYLNYK